MSTQFPKPPFGPDYAEEDLPVDANAGINPSDSGQEEDVNDSISEENEPLDSERLEWLLFNIYDHIQKRERTVREVHLRQWKYNQLLWQGIQPFWDATIGDWNSINQYAGVELPDGIIIDPSITSKTINIIRPYGESIAGAITTTLPKNKYFPADAEKAEDIQTAKAYSIIEKKIASDNPMEYKLLESILNWWKYGYVAAYNFSHSDKSYGSYKKTVQEPKDVELIVSQCPQCGTQISEIEEKPQDYTRDMLTTADILEDPLTNSREEAEEDQGVNQAPIPCPNCQEQITPMKVNIGTVKKEFPTEIEIPKCRQMIEIYSPLYAKIPFLARTQDEILWVILEEEKHFADLRYIYPEYYDSIKGGEEDADASYERYARANYEISAETLEEYTTVRRVWLRCAAFSICDQKEDADYLSGLFPDGVYYTIINREVVEIAESVLDDHWSFGFNPGENRIVGQAGCNLIVPISELTSELMSLEVRTMRHAIPTTFADPQYIDFTAFNRNRKEPGFLYPAKMSPEDGGSLANKIASINTANFPKEAEYLSEKLEKYAQFCSGALPQIFGGSTPNQTATAHAQDKNAALQRLSIILKLKNQLYADIMARAIKGYISDLLEDEPFVEQKGNSFVNYFIKKSELQGKVGKVVPETSDQFPTSWVEKRALMMELIQLNNEAIQSVIFSPENASLIAELIGLPNLYIPGDDDRNKELIIIAKLMAPVIDPATGQKLPPMQIPIDPVLDNPELHSEILKAFLNSDLGLELQDSDPMSYQAIHARLDQFQMIIQQQMMQQQMMAAQAQGGPQGQGKGNPQSDLPVQ